MTASLRALLALAADNPASRPVDAQAVRIAEAVIFAASEPVRAAELAGRLPASADVAAVLAEIRANYAGRGFNLVQVNGGWTFRTSPDVSFALAPEASPPQKLSRAALEVLAILAYHQPATRAEIEDIRGVSTSRGTLDLLLETGWIRMRGRRKSPGRPVTFGTTSDFLNHFGLDAITDLPGLEELQGLSLFEGRAPADLAVPTPSDDPALTDMEEALDPDALALGPTFARYD